jgi:hypothetical protein
MLLTLSLLLVAGPMHATPDTSRTVNGVVLPENISVAGKTLVLNGAAVRKKAIFKVYVAALYVAAKSQSADAILAEDEPRRMVMHFVRGVGKGKVCDAWTDGLKDNSPNASEDVKKEFADLCTLMADVKDGDEMSYTYIPGTGTLVVIAGQEKGTVGGREFSEALLRCWIGPKPGPGEGFKKDLLGQKD